MYNFTVSPLNTPFYIWGFNQLWMILYRSLYLLKETCYKYIHTIQTHFVERSTVTGLAFFQSILKICLCYFLKSFIHYIITDIIELKSATLLASLYLLHMFFFPPLFNSSVFFIYISIMILKLVFKNINFINQSQILNNSIALFCCAKIL